MNTALSYLILIASFFIFFGSISLLIWSLKSFKKVNLNDSTPYVNEVEEVDDPDWDCKSVN